MGNGQGRMAVRPHAAGPQQDIQVEHPRAPVLAAPDATEVMLNLLQARQQGRGFKIGGHKRRGICKLP